MLKCFFIDLYSNCIMLWAMIFADRTYIAELWIYCIESTVTHRQSTWHCIKPTYSWSSGYICWFASLKRCLWTDSLACCTFFKISFCKVNILTPLCWTVIKQMNGSLILSSIDIFILHIEKISSTANTSIYLNTYFSECVLFILTLQLFSYTLTYQSYTMLILNTYSIKNK